MAAYTTIDNPELYFQTKLFTGNGSTQSITLDGSENMQPDWVWIKNRETTDGHSFYDVIRGVNKVLRSDNNVAEVSQTNGLSAFDTDGFTIGDNGTINENADGIVSWNWKAGTSFTNDASATSIGSIDSTGSVSDTAGFSIVTWTGTGSAATIKHGLSTAPSLIITFCRSTGYHHSTFHHKNTSAPETDVVYFNLTNATADDSGFWNDTLPTTSVFSVGTDNSVNQSSETYVAYCFAEKQGYSKFGSYIGNGNVDGTFVYTGFKPAFLILKRSSTTGNWILYDNKRDIDNPVTTLLSPNQSTVESTMSTSQPRCDFYSNGFKMRGTGGDGNGSDDTILYFAFAESTFVNSKGVPNNAR